jgi:benzoyl-CoA reductase/2-hydroxyglutaryl-CoA dehydratase subunit BcrC/BadD/HgdB
MIGTRLRNELQHLEDHYSDRVSYARERAERGTAVIGFVGTDVPRELITAAGAMPLRLHSQTGAPSASAVRLLGEATDVVAQSILSQVLAGELDFLTGIVISRDSEASLQMFYVLRQLVARGTGMPPVHLIDLLHLPRPSTERYNQGQVVVCAQVLAGWTGNLVSGDSLAAAISVHRDLREQVAAVQALRVGGVVSGTAGLHVAAAADSLPPAEAVVWFERLVRSAAAEPEPVSGRGLRLFFCGSAQDQDGVYRAIEDADVQIVGEDHDWGMIASAASIPLSADSTYEGLLRQVAWSYHYRSPAAATAPLAVHALWSADQAAACGAAAVLCLTRVFDDAPAWDYPKMAEHLRDRGVPSVLVARQQMRPDPVTLRESLESIRETSASGRFA